MPLINLSYFYYGVQSFLAIRVRLPHIIVFPLAQDLLRLELTLFTRVRRNMKSLPLSLQEKALLNARINPFKPKRNLQLETTSLPNPLFGSFISNP